MHDKLQSHTSFIGAFPSLGPDNYFVYMTTKEETQAFFSLLGDRLCNENDASDILYSAVIASNDMTRIFNAFFGLNYSPETHEIHREYHIKGFRPDFFLKPKALNEETVIIEVKLFDQNYHWEDYLKLGGKHILLSAHKIQGIPSGWEVRYWDKLIEVIEKESEDNDLLQSVAKYLRKVAIVKTIQRIEFGKPLANLYLNRLLEQIIKEKGTPTRQRDDCESHLGWQYCIRDDSNKQLFWASFTYNFEEDFHGIEIAIWDCKGEEALSEKLTNCKHTATMPFRDDDGRIYITVKMKVDDFSKFTNAATKEQQKELLETFFVDVNEIVKAYYKNKQ